MAEVSGAPEAGAPAADAAGVAGAETGTEIAPPSVTAVDVTPNECPLEAPLTLTLAMHVPTPLHQCQWRVSYVVDMTGQRHVLSLGALGPLDYPAGPAELRFEAPGIDLAGIKRSWLNNAGEFACLRMKGKGGREGGAFRAAPPLRIRWQGGCGQ